MIEKLRGENSIIRKESKIEKPEKVEITQEELKDRKYDLIAIGELVLKKMGYKVNVRRGNWSSIAMSVEDEKGKGLWSEGFGEDS